MTSPQGAPLAAFLAVLLVLPACGKRGDPLPPVPKTPQPVRELTLAQRGGEVEIRLAAPRATAAGGRLGVVEVEVLRATHEGDFAKVALKDVKKAVPGEALVMVEPLPPPGTRLRVAARARVGGDASELSPVVTLLVQAPVPPPSALAARVVGGGVQLDWTGVVPKPVPTPTPSPTPTPTPASPAPSPSSLLGSAIGAASPTPTPSASPTPAPPKGAGFAVYRRAVDGEYGAAHLAPLDANSALDAKVAPGERWCYVVRVRASGEPLVESAPSGEVCVDVTDVVPPAAPVGVTALPREAAVEVSWSPSAEGDLAGYRIYRAGPGGTAERIGEVPAAETRFVDPAPGRGANHVYTVTAVDKAGNESPHSVGTEAHLP